MFVKSQCFKNWPKHFHEKNCQIPKAGFFPSNRTALNFRSQWYWMRLFSMIFKHHDNFSFCSMLYNKKICIVCKVMSSLQSRDSLKGERSIILTPSIFVNEFNTCKFKSRLSQCLKITWKVAFNIASEASYVYILSGQKFIKKGQK